MADEIRTDTLLDARGRMHRAFRADDPRPSALDSVLHGGMRSELGWIDDELNRRGGYRARQDDDAVTLALRDWTRYVTHQVTPALRGTYHPTPARLAKRLGISERRVQFALRRLGRG